MNMKIINCRPIRHLDVIQVFVNFWIVLLFFSPSSLKQVYEIQEPDLFPSGYSRSNHHKRDSHITRSKISYSLIESQPLSCTPACGHEFHALAFHPHPTFTTPLVGSAYWIRSKVCCGAFLWKQSMRLGCWLFSKRSSVVVWQLFLRRFPPLGLHNKRILNSSCLLILLILDRPHFLISLKENLSTEYTRLKTCD